MSGLKGLLKDFAKDKKTAAPAVESDIEDRVETEDAPPPPEAVDLKSALDGLIAVLESEREALDAGRLDKLPHLTQSKQLGIDRFAAAQKRLEARGPALPEGFKAELAERFAHFEALTAASERRLGAFKQAVSQLLGYSVRALERARGDGTYSLNGTLSRPSHLSSSGVTAKL